MNPSSKNSDMTENVTIVFDDIDDSDSDSDSGSDSDSDVKQVSPPRPPSDEYDYVDFVRDAGRTFKSLKQLKTWFVDTYPKLFARIEMGNGFLLKLKMGTVSHLR